MVGTKLRILVVDDEPDMLEIISSVLANEDCDIELRSSGQAGLDAIAEKLPDMVITDLRMPEVDGYAIIDAARSVDSARQPFVLVISGHVDEVEEKKLWKFGIHGILHKPFDLNELRKMYKTFVANREEN